MQLRSCLVSKSRFWFNLLLPILAAVWIMATMTILGITLNVLTVMVTALTIGLGIDYAIHIVERYREEILRQ